MSPHRRSHLLKSPRAGSWMLTHRARLSACSTGGRSDLSPAVGALIGNIQPAAGRRRAVPGDGLPASLGHAGSVAAAPAYCQAPTQRLIAAPRLLPIASVRALRSGASYGLHESSTMADAHPC